MYTFTVLELCKEHIEFPMVVLTNAMVRIGEHIRLKIRDDDYGVFKIVHINHKGFLEEDFDYSKKENNPSNAYEAFPRITVGDVYVEYVSTP